MSTPKPAPFQKEDVKGVECRFATYLPPPPGCNFDLHLVKLNVQTKSGENIPHLRFIKDAKQDFYITKEAFRQHKQKKEWEQTNRLDKFTTTRSKLYQRIAQAIDRPFNGNPRQLFRSPYVYGADASSTSLIKHKYLTHQKKMGVDPTPYTSAALDIEADVVDGTDRMTMCSITFGKRAYTAILRDFVKGHVDVVNQLQEMANQYLPEYVAGRGVQWEIEIVEDEAQILTNVMARAHEWKPDVLEIWNIEYEIPKFISIAQRYNLNLADLFSDPAVPEAFRFFNYNRGPTVKVTASGKSTPIKPSAQWHIVEAPASFRVMDGMQIYRQVRTGQQELQSYSLDAILRLELKLTKLRFTEADHIREGSIEWHQFMQSKYKLQYIVYNLFDCIALELLEEKIKDIAFTMPTFAMASDFDIFNSQPKRKVNELHFELLERGLVIGTTSDQMRDKLDDELYSLAGWIVTLPAQLNELNGLPLIEDNPLLRTNIFTHVADLDVSSSYPNNGAVLNISKQTTRTEMIGVEGVPLETARMQGLNLSGGQTNAVEFMTTIFNAPTKVELLQIYDDQWATYQASKKAA